MSNSIIEHQRDMEDFSPFTWVESIAREVEEDYHRKSEQLWSDVHDKFVESGKFIGSSGMLNEKPGTFSNLMKITSPQGIVYCNYRGEKLNLQTLQWDKS